MTEEVSELLKKALALPPEARAALTEWYRRDYEFLDLCRELAARDGGS